MRLQSQLPWHLYPIACVMPIREPNKHTQHSLQMIGNVCMRHWKNPSKGPTKIGPCILDFQICFVGFSPKVGPEGLELPCQDLAISFAEPGTCELTCWCQGDTRNIKLSSKMMIIIYIYIQYIYIYMFDDSSRRLPVMTHVKI